VSGDTPNGHSPSYVNHRGYGFDVVCEYCGAEMEFTGDGIEFFDYEADGICPE